MRLCVFVEQHSHWQDKIQKRADSGKDLAPKQREKFEAWKLGCQPRLVFSKDKKVVISEASKVKPDCIAIQLIMSDDPTQLQVISSSGVAYRLKLLSGFKKTGPEFLQAWFLTFLYIHSGTQN